MDMRLSKNTEPISVLEKLNKKSSKNKYKRTDSGISFSESFITSRDHLYHLLLEQVVCKNENSGHTILSDLLSGRQVSIYSEYFL